MTERVDILFGQALDKAVSETWTTLDADQLDRLKDKFALLIVRECAEVAGCNGHVSGFALGDLIKEHFGVE